MERMEDFRKLLESQIVAFYKLKYKVINNLDVLADSLESMKTQSDFGKIAKSCESVENVAIELASDAGFIRSYMEVLEGEVSRTNRSEEPDK